MFTPQAIGYVQSPYNGPDEIPKGFGAKHDAEGVLSITPEFQSGLTDIEGFSHLFVIWEFDRSDGFELLGTPPTDTRPHGVFATRSPYRPNPLGLTVVELLRREDGALHVRGVDMVERNSHSRYQALSLQHTHGKASAGMAWRGGVSKGPKPPSTFRCVPGNLIHSV